MKLSVVCAAQRSIKRMETENFLKAEPVANAEATERVNVTNAQDGVSETDHVLPVAGGADDEEGPSLPEIREELRRLREENEALESRNASLEEESVRLEKRAELMRSELEEIRPIAEAGRTSVLICMR